MMLTPVLIAAGFGLAVMLFAAGLVSLRPTTETRARGRLASMAIQADTYRRDESYLQDESASGIGAVDRMLRGRAWTDRTRRELDRAGIPMRVGEYIAIRILAIVSGLLAGQVVSGLIDASGPLAFFLVIVGIVLGFAIPPMIVRRRITKRREAFESQLVELCEITASMLQSGYGYIQALTATANEIEPPLADELKRMLDKVRLGGDVDEALEELTDRLDSSDFEIVSSAIAVQRKSGGNLSDILMGVAETIRDRQSLYREVKALTAKERYSAVIVAGFPPVLIGVLCLISPEVYTRLFTETLGQIMLAVAACFDVAGYLVIKRVTKLEV